MLFEATVTTDAVNCEMVTAADASLCEALKKRKEKKDIFPIHDMNIMFFHSNI